VEPWVIAVIVGVIVVGIVLALIFSPLRRVIIRSGDVETEVDGAGPGSLRTSEAEFDDSKVKGRGAKLDFQKTKSKKSNFDVR
jgi:hypothetical protein